MLEDVPPTARRAATPPLVGVGDVAPRPSTGAPAARKAGAGKKSAAESWAEWRATGSAASAESFCQSVSAWIEGASAQLVRPLWPAGGVRPTSREVQGRLRQGLALVLTEEADYVKALEAARVQVARELSKRRARDLAAG